MKTIEWSEEKNQQLIKERGISFEHIALCILEKNIIDIIDHPNNKKYRHQKVYVIEIHDYIWAVASVEDEEKIFLKTAFPSRKLRKIYKNISEE